MLEEKPQQKPQTAVNCYDTGVPQFRKRRGCSLTLLLSLLLLGVIVTVVLLFDFQITRSDGTWSLQITRRGTSSGKKPIQSLLSPSTDLGEPEQSESDFSDPIDGSTVTLHISKGTEGDALSLQDIYRKVSASVVVVSTSSGDYCSGIVMSSDGYIITSYRTAGDSGSVTVTLSNGRSYDGYAAGGDSITDISIVKINTSGLTAAEFCTSDTAAVGDTVVAIGNPFGAQLSSTLTDGIIAAVHRDLAISGTKLSLLQTTAVLSEGNYGGPLINTSGQVIGINIAKYSASYNSSTVEGIGFALPMETVKSIVDDLLQNGYVSGRVSYGFTVEDLPELQRYYYGFPTYAVISAIETDSTAYQAGLRPGDAIVAIGTTQIDSAADFATASSDYTAGDTVRLTIYRGSEYYICEFVLREQTKRSG